MEKKNEKEIEKKKLNEIDECDIKWFPQLILQSFRRYFCVRLCQLLRVPIRGVCVCVFAGVWSLSLIDSKMCSVFLIRKRANANLRETFPEYSVTYRTIYMHVIFSLFHFSHLLIIIFLSLFFFFLPPFGVSVCVCVNC